METCTYLKQPPTPDWAASPNTRAQLRQTTLSIQTVPSVSSASLQPHRVKTKHKWKKSLLPNCLLRIHKFHIQLALQPSLSPSARKPRDTGSAQWTKPPQLETAFSSSLHGEAPWARSTLRATLSGWLPSDAEKLQGGNIFHLFLRLECRHHLRQRARPAGEPSVVVSWGTHHHRKHVSKKDFFNFFFQPYWHVTDIQHCVSSRCPKCWFHTHFIFFIDV